jgi:trimeric autotransporter adhesin
LTAIGAPGPNLYVAEKISGNRFRIAGGKPGAEVSWQVTGIRHDAWANAHRSAVEVEKTAAERGRYLHPEVFALTAEQSVTYHGDANRRKLPDLRSKRPERRK